MHNAPVPGNEEPGPWPGGLTSGAETAPMPKPVGPEARGGAPGEYDWFGGPGATGETSVLPAADGGGQDDTLTGPVRVPGDPLRDPLPGAGGVPGDPGGAGRFDDPLGVPLVPYESVDPLGVGGVPVEPVDPLGVPDDPLRDPLRDPLPGAGGVPGEPDGAGRFDDPLGLPGPDGVPGAPPAPALAGEPVEPVAPDMPGVPGAPAVDGTEGPVDGAVDVPPAPPGPAEPRAARGTTIALVVALVLVVVMSGALGAVAVMMTRNPDAPPLKQTSVRTLLTPVHFAPVTGVGPAPCTGTDAIPDDKGASCYQLDPGVTVTTVQKIEEVPENDGTYSIRLVLSPSSQEQIAALTRETVKQQLAVVVGEKVVAAPRVAQEITQDSLGISGFDKAQADAIMALLTGSAPAGQQPNPAASPSAADAGQPGGTQPDGTQQGGTQPGGGTQPDGTQQGGTQPDGTQPDGTQQGGTQPGGTQQGGTQPDGTQPGGTQQGGGQPSIEQFQ
ncbi:SecDF P1 head subdomain-containing protein [Microbispora sp. H13382]|uniref:SecDF P1 head subdomain-containing protein n=1 Tax=Microbispora sp. H13382 TaxID=2729112 RepID=UPI0037C7F2DF